MISDNNNNNNNNNFEYLFWKVMHNKYLFNLIIQKIEDIIIEIKFDNPNIRSFKFKDITSFSWMLDKGLFNLLIYKLKNQDRVIIDSDGIDIILNFMFDGNFDLEQLRYKEKTKFDSNITFVEDFEETKDKMKLKLIKESIYEIFLILKYNNFNNNAIVKLIRIGFNDPEKALKLLQILVVEQNIFQLTSYHFSLVLTNFDLPFIKRFIEIASDSKSIITDETFRNDSITLLLNENQIFYTDKNISVNQDVLEFILDHPEYHSQYYNSTFTPSESVFQYCTHPYQHKRKYFQSWLNSSREGDIKYMCHLRLSIQIKLMELKYFRTFEALEYQSRIFSTSKHEEKKMLRHERDLTNNFLKDINNSDLDGLSKVKQVYDFLSKYSVCNSFKQSFNQ